MARNLRYSAAFGDANLIQQVTSLLRHLLRPGDARRLGVSLMLMALSGAIAAAPVQYMYDEIGRLVGAVDAAGSGTTYNYDAAGNLISVTPTGVVSIISFTPKSGPVGTSVTLQGTGFSATPASNTVQFNGTAATVSSATVNQIVVVVPAGATSGIISVTTPLGSATSATPFTVGANLTPTIFGFTPISGASGTPVTITGTNYQPSPTNNTVTFAGKFASLTSTTPTTLSVTAPGGVVSGKIAVTTPYGQAISTSDFFAVPPGFNPADVQATGRFVVDGSSASVSITTSGKIGLFLFDGIQNQNLGLGVSNMTCTGPGLNTSLTVYTPDGVALSTPSFASVPGTSIKLPTLPKSGTYEIVVDPSGADTCTMTLTISTEIIGGAIAVDGSVAALSTRSGQNARYTFAGTVGQNLGLGWSAMTTTPAGNSVIGRFFKPDGTLLATCNFFAIPGNCNLQTLPVAGTYTLTIEPQGGSAVNITLTLSNDVIVGTLVANGAAQTFTTTRVGQNGRYTFTGTAGLNYSLLWTGTTFVGSSTVISVLKPDGTQLTQANTDSVSAPSGTVDLTNLPVTGTYTVFIDPFAASTGQVTLALKQDATGTISINGAALPITLAAGQNGRYTFAGTAGQNLGLGWSAFTTTPAGGVIVGRLYQPNGSLVHSCNFYTTPGNCNLIALPVTGTYTIAIDPQGANAANVTLTLSTEITGALTVNGVTVTFTTTRIGQNARYTFSGTAGVSYSLLWSSTTFVGVSTVINVLKPDGTQLNQANASSTSAPSGTLNLGSLPVTGTYSVFIDPFGASTGSITVRVTSP